MIKKALNTIKTLTNTSQSKSSVGADADGNLLTESAAVLNRMNMSIENVGNTIASFVGSQESHLACF
ncbi:hypothetical protein DPMN_055389 [Dreissena polymorpha]|uniref:Uncharacterized protein n=1 Tax=Dreissena polymorpha TaxID=45954 RepID=A0A9D4HU17_DREPO|nr:hypothetical protein DPMN_055389 [Dreissena polymorpha]